MCFKNKYKPMRVITIIPVKINEHNPKAQSVCYPDEPVDYNEFYKNLYKQLKNYDNQRSNFSQTEVSVRKRNNDKK